MIKINTFWVNQVKNIVNEINKGIKQRSSEIVKGNLLELMKLLNEKYDNEIRSSAAMAFVEISELHPKFLKNIISAILNLLNDEDSFIVSYAINTLDNLFENYPEEVRKALQNMKNALNSYDPAVRKMALNFIKRIVEKYPSYIKRYEETITEIKLTTHDLDRSISSLANEIMKIIENIKSVNN
ncbi:MAG: HEAT repeat domain-containing protein [Promethearchaeota archaeon]